MFSVYMVYMPCLLCCCRRERDVTDVTELAYVPEPYAVGTAPGSQVVALASGPVRSQLRRGKTVGHTAKHTTAKPQQRNTLQNYDKIGKRQKETAKKSPKKMRKTHTTPSPPPRCENSDKFSAKNLHRQK